MPSQRRRRSAAVRPSVAEDRTGPAPDVTDDVVRGRAYEIFEGRGAQHGHDIDDWLQAERELRLQHEKDQ